MYATTHWLIKVFNAYIYVIRHWVKTFKNNIVNGKYFETTTTAHKRLNFFSMDFLFWRKQQNAMAWQRNKPKPWQARNL